MLGCIISDKKLGAKPGRPLSKESIPTKNAFGIIQTFWIVFLKIIIQEEAT